MDKRPQSRRPYAAASGSRVHARIARADRVHAGGYGNRSRKYQLYCAKRGRTRPTPAVHRGQSPGAGNSSTGTGGGPAVAAVATFFVATGRLGTWPDSGKTIRGPFLNFAMTM